MPSRAAALSYAARRIRTAQLIHQQGRIQAGAYGVDARGAEYGTTRSAIFYGPQLPRARRIGEQEAMGQPFFGRSVELLANAVAGTEWYARRWDPTLGIKIPLAEQPNIVTNPSPLQTLWAYKWAVAEDGILYGNHFALNGELDWRTGRPGWTIPLPADQVWIHTDPANPGWYEWIIGGQQFDVDEIFHIPFGARSGEILGRGVLQQYADWLAGADAAEQWSRDAFAAGALPPAVITVNGAAGQTDLDLIKEKWRELSSTREPIVLPTGTELKPIVGNAQTSQLVEARTWNATATAAAVGVPSWKLGLQGPTMTYQNVETGDIDFVRDSVDRFARPITEAITKWLFAAGNELVWDYDSRMRADSKTQAEVNVAYHDSGILLTDEIRARLNRPPLPAPQPQPNQAPGNTQGDVDTAIAAAAAAQIPVTGGIG